MGPICAEHRWNSTFAGVSQGTSLKENQQNAKLAFVDRWSPIFKTHRCPNLQTQSYFHQSPCSRLGRAGATKVVTGLAGVRRSCQKSKFKGPPDKNQPGVYEFGISIVVGSPNLQQGRVGLIRPIRGYWVVFGGLLWGVPSYHGIHGQTYCLLTPKCDFEGRLEEWKIKKHQHPRETDCLR